MGTDRVPHHTLELGQKGGPVVLLQNLLTQSTLHGTEQLHFPKCALTALVSEYFSAHYAGTVAAPCSRGATVQWALCVCHI